MSKLISAAEVVHGFLHREPAQLRESTIFYDTMNRRILRTRQGKIIALGAKDNITEDAYGDALINGDYF